MRSFLDRTDYGITVIDLCSNLGGMMILLACLGLVARPAARRDAVSDAASGAKPIEFPLTNMPAKDPVVLCLKSGRLYDLMELEKAALMALARQAHAGEPVREVQLSRNGVEVTAAFLPTAEGFDFNYTLDLDGGIPLADSRRVHDKLVRIRERFPAGKFFVDIWVWPEEGCFRSARSLLEWLHTAGIEAGWTVKDDMAEGAETIGYTLGEGTDDYRSFTCQ